MKNKIKKFNLIVVAIFSITIFLVSYFIPNYFWVFTTLITIIAIIILSFANYSFFEVKKKEESFFDPYSFSLVNNLGLMYQVLKTYDDKIEISQFRPTNQLCEPGDTYFYSKNSNFCYLPDDKDHGFCYSIEKFPLDLKEIGCIFIVEKSSDDNLVFKKVIIEEYGHSGYPTKIKVL